jgi:spore coat protein A, manganese oxidase
MKLFTLLLLFTTLSLGYTNAQTTLDPITHPKFQNPVPLPTQITVGSATTVMQMAQTTQWLGLVDANNARLQTTVWGYGLSTGTVSYPGPTLVATSNAVSNIEWRNNLPTTHLLPIDHTYHMAMPASGVPTVVHLHGAHVEAASDGNPDAWYTSGYAQKGTAWLKPVYSYANTQEAANLWYHDHALGMTRLNVYAGLAGQYRINDANDQAVNLPRGNYDRELMIQDKMFDNTGKLFLPTDPNVLNGGMPEFFGDFILVNGMVWPFMNVEPRKYRFRMVNGSDSRVYIFKLSNNASFFQIGTDGGKLNNPAAKTQLTLAPGERADIVMDFSTMNGQTIILQNIGTDAPFGNPASVVADPATTGQILQFRVNQPLNTAIPDVTLAAATNLRPNLGAITNLGAPIKTRKLALFEGADDLGRILPMLGIVDPTQPALDGSLLWHQPVTENVGLNDTEIWEIYNTTADAHPVHLHLVHFQILNKQTFTGTLTNKQQPMHSGAFGTGAVLSGITLTGAPTNYAANDNGWKDTHILLPGEMMQIKAKFDLTGEYVWHCHILSHEDHDMMRRLVVGNPCVGDATPPTLSACPANQNLTTTGTATTATVTWTVPTATDNCSTPSVTFTTSPTANLTNGGQFPIGTTTVTYMAMDGNNNMSMCSFTVVVSQPNVCTNDVTPPVLSACPANQNLTTTGTATTATATWTAPTATDNCSTPSVTFTTSPTANLTNGGAFPIGTTTVTYMAMDARNNMSTCRFTVGVSQGATGGNVCTSPNTNIVGGAGSITVSGITTSSAIIQVLNSSFVTVYNQQVSTSTATVPNLPAGNYLVNVTVLQAGGVWPAVCTPQVNVTVTTATNPCTTDATPPVLTACPANQNLTTAATTATATWTAPTATDNCSTPSVTFTTSPTANLTNGGAFPIGTTTVTYMAMDARNNISTCRFTVVVSQNNPCATDATPPVLTACPANKNLTTTGTTAAATWTAPTATDNCSTPSVSFTTSPTANLTNGGAFPIGTTTVTYMAMDARNNMSTCRFTVVVSQTNLCATDVTPPVFTVCPTSFSITTTATTQIATYATPTATDNCGTATVSRTAGLASGSAFPIGATAVSYMAMDARNNMSVCNFTVTVVDLCSTDAVKPILTACPANQNLTTTGTTATATWTAPTATDNCSTPSVSFVTSPTTGLTNGGAFPVGTTTVSYTAKDSKNNASTCYFTVNVTKTNPCITDVTPPVFVNCPTNMTVSVGLLSICKPTTWTAPTATDNCSTPTVYQSAGPISGTCVFPSLIPTTISYTAIDAKGNRSSCSFTIKVVKTLNLFLQSNQVLTMDAIAQHKQTYIEFLNNTGYKNDFFTIEKLDTATGDFKVLATINNLSNDTTKTYYKAYDDNPDLGDNTYRVKLVFKDGTVIYSDNRTVRYEETQDVKLYPNPVSSELHMDMRNFIGNIADIYIYNSMGQMVMTNRQHMHDLRSSMLNLDISGLISGEYLIRMVVEGKKDFVKKVSIIH